PRTVSATENRYRPRVAEVDGRPAVRFDGRDDHVIAPNDAAFRVTEKDAFTLAAWVWLGETPKGRWRGVVTKSREEAPWYGLWLDPQGRWIIGASGDAVVGPEGRKGWQHVAAVQDADGRKLYIDGKLAGQGKAMPGTGPGPMILGGAGGVEEYLPGALGEVRLYRKALTADDVQKLAAP
ncbi:MAG TPA: LamG domain-containing protein, partial [Planctomycetota bacterium]|nr:LamG domain-containing protein [Planctomycetota bacterium]